MNKYFIALALLLPIASFAQTSITGPLLIQNKLGEIAANGTQSTVRGNIGLGSMATQSAGAVAITGGTIGNVTFSSTAVINTVSNTYTYAGAIAVTDTFALINSGPDIAMTLAAGTRDGFPVIINNYGPGTATVTLNIQGSSTPVALPSGSVLNVSWNASLSTYLLTS